MKKFMYFGIAAIALSMAACSSDDEVAQPENFGEAVKAGRNAYLAGPGAVKTIAEGSTPLTGFLR